MRKKSMINEVESLIAEHENKILGHLVPEEKSNLKINEPRGNTLNLMDRDIFSPLEYSQNCKINSEY